MLELMTLVWAFVIFFAFAGFQRGWKRELVGIMGIMLGAFSLFQFDSLLAIVIMIA